MFGLGPVGQLTARIAVNAGCRVIGVDLVDERLELARAWGVEVIDLRDVDDVPAAILELTGGRGADGTVDAVGMEAHGSGVAKAAIGAVGMLPDGWRSPSPTTSRSTGRRLSSTPSSPSAAAARSRCRASTAVRWTRCR